MLGGARSACAVLLGYGGIGHLSRYLSASASIGHPLVSEGDGPFYRLMLDAKVHPRFWPGVDVQYENGANWSAALRLTIPFQLDLSAAGDEH